MGIYAEYVRWEFAVAEKDVLRKVSFLKRCDFEHTLSWFVPAAKSYLCSHVFFLSFALTPLSGSLTTPSGEVVFDCISTSDVLCQIFLSHVCPLTGKARPKSLEPSSV